MNKIRLYSVVYVTHLEKSQSTWEKDVIGKYALVTTIDNECMLTFLDTGQKEGWYSISQLKILGQINSIKDADEMKERCEKMLSLSQENTDALLKHKILEKVYL